MNGKIEAEAKGPRRIVLCFDGTGNSFQAAPNDTNIVKLYEMMDRSTNDQFHYYQPGIGTYTRDESEGLLRIWPAIKARVMKAVDQGLGTTFREHVIAGYQFLMKYYEDGDDIYVFGFSRGAYTARFLAQMIFRIGLLSRGNDEMIPFAWSTFSSWLRTTGDGTAEDLAKQAYMKKFRHTFCRSNVEVLFLGIFDCVNSVGTFEAPFWSQSYKRMPLPPAKYIRHAVSIHERRLKFKPALFEADLINKTEHVKEVWFCGNHGDVGGGWGYEEGQAALLSDEPLQWMLDELANIPVAQKLRMKSWVYTPEKNEPMQQAKLGSWFWWRPQLKLNLSKIRQNTMRPHDPLALGGGGGWFSVFSWWILEVLPVFSRLELIDGRWIPQHWPPNFGATRDLPENAELHRSVYSFHRAGVLKKLPKLGGDGPPRMPKISSAFLKLDLASQAQETEADKAQG